MGDLVAIIILVDDNLSVVGEDCVLPVASIACRYSY